MLADYANLTNVNISDQPELVLVASNSIVAVITTLTNSVFPFRFSNPFDSLSGYTNIPLLTTSKRVRTVQPGAASVRALYLGFSNTVPLTVSAPEGFTLLHRYSFNEPAGSYRVQDSIGTAHGKVIGAASGAALSGKGELAIGMSSLGYLKLPADIISGESEISFEAWFVYQGWILPGYWNAWTRVFDFGDQLNGMGKTYFFVTPLNDFNQSRTAVSSNGIPAERTILDATFAFPFSQTSHVAVTYSPFKGIARFYINGQMVRSGAAQIPLAFLRDVNNWLGRSQFVEDPYFKGRFGEFRIYRGFLQDQDVAVNYSAGPDVIGLDLLLQTSISNMDLTITWGESAVDWTLQSSLTLGDSAVWDPVPITPILDQGRFQVTVPMQEAAQYFRLRAP